MNAQAVFKFRNAFGKMYVDALPELPGKVQDSFQVFLIAGVYGMRTEHEGYPFAPGEPLAFGDMLVYAALTALRAGKSACHHRAQPAFLRRRGGSTGEHMHIAKCAGAGAYHFRGSLHCAPVCLIRGHFILARHDPFKKPFFEGHIIRTAAKRRHIRVSVRVDGCGHADHAGGIDHPLRGKARGSVPDIKYPFAGNGNIGYAAAGQTRVFYQKFHSNAPFCSFSVIL